MLNYEEFKKVLEEQLSSYLPESLAGSKVELRCLEKVNRSVDEIAIIPLKESGQSVFPCLRVDELYDEYQRIGDAGAIMELVAGKFLENNKNAPAIVMNQDTLRRDRIVMMLINTEQNKQLLETLPHREFLDLSIVYRLGLGSNKDGLYYSMVDNKLAKAMGMNEQELFQAAYANTRELLPPVVVDMNDITRAILKRQGMSDEMIEESISYMPNGIMYVISNPVGANGAVSMLYEDELQKLAEKVGSDLYILPSSLHEVIVVPSHLGELEELADMVHMVNMKAVRLEERLSNQVYHYDKELSRFSIATNNPSKLIESQVAEPQMIYETGRSR